MSGCATPGEKHFSIKGLSPDGKLGITIPTVDENWNTADGGNRLVEVKTGRVIAELEGEPAESRMNHGGWTATWSTDGGLVCWGVFGKWTSVSIVLVKLKDGQVQWQKDVSPACQKEILHLTQAADPVGYARAKASNRGSGAHFPEGFAIDIELDDKVPLALPLTIHVDLTSDVKAVDDESLRRRVDSWMEAVLDENGKLTFGEFHLGGRPGPSKAFGA